MSSGRAYQARRGKACCFGMLGTLLWEVRVMRKDHYKCALLQKGKRFLGGSGGMLPSIES